MLLPFPTQEPIRMYPCDRKIPKVWFVWRLGDPFRFPRQKCLTTAGMVKYTKARRRRTKWHLFTVLSQGRCLLLSYSPNLKKEATCTSEHCDFQRTTRRCIPDGRTLHNHRCDNFKSCSCVEIRHGSSRIQSEALPYESSCSVSLILFDRLPLHSSSEYFSNPFVSMRSCRIWNAMEHVAVSRKAWASLVTLCYFV
jgi:hypothetical protein